MKKIFYSACLTLSTMSAYAQSSNLTVYGVNDIGISRISNIKGHASNELTSGLVNTSRIGFRGTEDLGGGLSAIFNLEAGTALDTGGAGSSSSFWNRASFLGLRSSSFGTITLGKQRTAIFDVMGNFSGQSYFGGSAARIEGAPVAGSTLAIQGFNNRIGTDRPDNSIKYTSASFSGLKFHGMWGFGEVKGSNNAARYIDVGASYKNGPVQLGASYVNQKCNLPEGCSPTQKNDTVWAIGGAYDFGVARVLGYYSSEKNARFNRGANADTYTINVVVPVDQWSLVAGFQRLNDKTTPNQDINQYNLIAIYKLSKRTSLYGMAARQTVSNGGIAALTSGVSSNGSQNLFSLGIRHFF